MTTKFKHTWPQRETNSSKQNIAKIKNIKDQNWSCENKSFQQEKQSRQTFHNYCISTITLCVCVKPQAVCASFFYLALPWDGQRNVLGLWVCDVFTKRLKLLTHREPRWFSWTRLSFLWRGSSFFFSLSLRSPFELPLLSYTLPFILISNFYSLLFTVVLSSSLHLKRNKMNSNRKEKIHISATQS